MARAPTGSHPAMDERQAADALSPNSGRGSRQSLPPPPPADVPEVNSWLAALRNYAVDTRSLAHLGVSLGQDALAAAKRIEDAIGEEPAPAQGKSGKGLLLALHGVVRDREISQRRRDDVRLVVGAIVGTITLIAAIVGLLKALGWAR